MPHCTGGLIGVIEPNRPRYIAGARRRYEGQIRGIMDGRLYGWCRLTHSTAPITLEVLVDEKPTLSVVADVFRQSILDARIGKGATGSSSHWRRCRQDRCGDPHQDR